MSFFGRRNQESKVEFQSTVEDMTPEPVMEPPAATEIAIEAEDDEPNGRISKGSRISGQLAFDGTIRIYGEVEGEIVAGESVIVRRGGRVNAKIRANEVVIEGDVTADVEGMQRVEIGATGRLCGKVVAPRLVIHEGGVFDGTSSVSMAADRVAAKSTPYAEGSAIDEAAEDLYLAS